MEMTSDFAHNMFKVDYISSLVSIGQGDVLAPGSPFKEKDI